MLGVLDDLMMGFKQIKAELTNITNNDSNGPDAGRNYDFPP